jgi:hypothetical protein
MQSYGHQVAMTAAMQRASAARVAPLAYLSGLWGLAADALLFHHAPSLTSLVGGAAICAGGLLVAYEHRILGIGGGGGGHGGDSDGGGLPLISSTARLARTGSSSSVPSASAQLRSLVPVFVQTISGGATPSSPRSASFAEGPVTPSLLRVALANAWLHTAQPPPHLQPLLAAKVLPVVLQQREERELAAAAVNAAIRLA